MLKIKVKVKGHVIRALSWILGMSYSVIDGLVLFYFFMCHFSVNELEYIDVASLIFLKAFED